MYKYEHFFFAGFLALDLVLGAAAGYSSYHGNNFLWILLMVACLFSTWAALRTSHIRFGFPEMEHGNHCVDLVGTVWSAILACCLWLSGFAFPHHQHETCYPCFFAALAFCLLGMLTIFIGFRGWPVLNLGICILLSYFLQCMRGRLQDVVLMKIGLLCITCSYTRYLHEQRLALSIGVQPIVAFLFGRYIHMGFIGRGVIVGFISVLFIYVNLLARRCQRSLPSGLLTVRFLRLGYLRKALYRNEQFVKCQDLPAEAFGDPAIAEYVIILSHRWLDPVACDMRTEKHPHGVKLACLLAKLELYFSLAAIRSPYDTRGWFRRIHSACCVGGWDVVIFFDFTSIPQRGIGENGVLIPRTPEEQRIFDTCLPNMGTLYSRFPVLVLKDAPFAGAAQDYFESGWCVCEFNVALISKTLRPYSADVVDNAPRRLCIATEGQLQDVRLGRISTRTCDLFEERMSKQLQSKHFLYDSDRIVAEGMLRGLAVRRALLERIYAHDLVGVRDFIARLVSKDLLATLDEPVDEALNTLLHIAVQTNCTDIVEELLSYGVQANARNVRGDTPAQWFMLPRMNNAAAICRQHERAKGIERGTTLSTVQLREVMVVH